LDKPILVQFGYYVNEIADGDFGRSFRFSKPPTPEWGSMLGAERNQVFTAPHLVFLPGIAIALTVLSFNLLGDGLRDALDPRLAHVS